MATIRHLFLLLFTGATWLLSAQPVTVDVRVEGVAPGSRITLAEAGFSDGKSVPDTTLVFPEGKDSIRITTGKSGRMLALLLQDGDGVRQQTEFFAEPGESYAVDGRADDFAGAKISGGLYDTGGLDEITAMKHRLDSLLDRGASAQEIAQAAKDLVFAKEKFIVYHPNNAYSAMLISDLITQVSKYTTVDRVRRLYDSLNGKARNTHAGEVANEEMYLLLGSSEGASAPRFTLTSFDGELISPSHFRGKWVLLYFWASWCGACREDFPELRRWYEKYHPRGLEMIGLACRDEDAAWREAVSGVQLPGVQVRADEEIAGQESVTRTFLVSSLPQAILVDPAGKIVFRGQPSQLPEKLKEVFGQ